MNWDYISGFFDADGSITMTSPSKNKNKTIQVSFHNNELNILTDIEKFINNDLNIKGIISLKKAKKKTHSDSYELKYTFQRGYIVSQKLISIHPKKKYRIEIYDEIQKFTKRNGKYSKEELEHRNSLIEEFFNY